MSTLRYTFPNHRAIFEILRTKRNDLVMDDFYKAIAARLANQEVLYEDYLGIWYDVAIKELYNSQPQLFNYVTDRDNVSIYLKKMVFIKKPYYWQIVMANYYQCDSERIQSVIANDESAKHAESMSNLKSEGAPQVEEAEAEVVEQDDSSSEVEIEQAAEETPPTITPDATLQPESVLEEDVVDDAVPKDEETEQEASNPVEVPDANELKSMRIRDLRQYADNHDVDLSGRRRKNDIINHIIQVISGRASLNE